MWRESLAAASGCVAQPQPAAKAVGMTPEARTGGGVGGFLPLPPSRPLRRYLRKYFERHAVRALSALLVLSWTAHWVGATGDSGGSRSSNSSATRRARSRAVSAAIGECVSSSSIPITSSAFVSSSPSKSAKHQMSCKQVERVSEGGGERKSGKEREGYQ